MSDVTGISDVTRSRPTWASSLALAS